MSRPKLIDYYRVEDGQMPFRQDPTLQKAFQLYLERQVIVVANYVKKRWGVRPNGLLNAVELSSVKMSWGDHYILTIIVPRNIKQTNDIERGIVKYAINSTVVPGLLSLAVQRGNQFGQDVDIIAIEAKTVFLAIAD